MDNFNFQMRCPACNRLLCRSNGEGDVEVKCPKCKSLVLSSYGVVTLLEPPSEHVQERYEQKRFTVGDNKC